MLGDVLKMAVPLRGLGLGRVARHRGRARRDDNGRFWMALGHAGVDAVLVVATIAGDSVVHGSGVGAQ